MECLKGKSLALIDLETSGKSATSSVIEVGILRIENGTCTETYRTTVNPGRAISPWITSLTGITTEETMRAPYFDDIIDDVERLLSDAIFVAHNAPFDYAFIEREFARRARRFRAPRLCTAQLSRRLYPNFRRHSLAHLIERHDLFVLERHRAFDDAYALWQFLQLSARHPRFSATFDALVRKPAPRLFEAFDDEVTIR